MNKQETAIRSLVNIMKVEPNINNISPIELLTHAKQNYDTEIDPLVARNVIRYIRTFGEMGGAL